MTKEQNLTKINYLHFKFYQHVPYILRPVRLVNIVFLNALNNVKISEFSRSHLVYFTL